MSDHDLLDRMVESTAWTRTATIDPASDVARGRVRLRRRRVGFAAATVSVAGVAALAAGPIVGNWPTVSDREAAGPTSSAAPAASGPAVERCTCSEVQSSRKGWFQYGWATADAKRLMQILGKHADPSGRHLSAPPYSPRSGCTSGYDHRIVGPWIDISARWREGAAQDQVRVQVNPPGNYGDPQLGPAYAHPHLSACKKVPWPAFTPYTCGTRTIAGKRVVVGTSNLRGYTSYLVGYVRPDGQLVTARVESGVHTDPQTPQPKNPIRKPSVTIEQLVRAATDPGMTLR